MSQRSPITGIYTRAGTDGIAITAGIRVGAGLNAYSNEEEGCNNIDKLHNCVRQSLKVGRRRFKDVKKTSFSSNGL
jgi:hypothetical protein